LDLLILKALNASNLAAGFPGVLAAAALALAAFGTFTLLAFIVTSRRTELGIRIALGAGPGRLVADILRVDARWMFTGQLCGLCLALGAGQVLGSIWYGVGPAKPAILGVTLLVSTLCLACVLPASHILRVNPVTAIRQE
jgi:ABC-type antimicrobial peptide transport system permease subunit